MDKRLDAIGSDEAKALRGKAAVANALLAYAAYDEVIASDRWKQLADAGANPQRPLWASTGVKNPDYPDTLYVTDLVVADTVNTMPEKTLEAFADHGEVKGDVVSGRGDEAQALFDQLSGVGIDLDDVFVVLETEGVDKFTASWDELVETVEKQMEAAPAASCRDEREWRRWTPTGDATASGARRWRGWQLADGFQPDLRAWFAEDAERASALTFTAADLLVDLSKGLVDGDVLAALLALADQVGVAARRDAMFRGEHINVTEDRAVLHTALRLPATRRQRCAGRRPGRRQRRARRARAGSTTSPTGSAPAPGPASPASGSAPWSTSASAAPTSVR